MDRSLRDILERVRRGELTPAEGARLMQAAPHDADRGTGRDAERVGHEAANASGAAGTPTVAGVAGVAGQAGGAVASHADVARDYVLDALVDVFQLPRDRIRPDASFGTLGIDSRGFVELLKRLQADLGPLPRTLLFEYPTAARLAAHLQEQHYATLAERNTTAAPQNAAAGRPQASAPAIPPPVTPSPVTPAPVTATPATPAPAAAAQGTPASAARVAIVGLAGRFPMADDLDAFWANIAAGRNGVTEVPPERWDTGACYDPVPGASGKACGKWGGFIARADAFDYAFFGMAPREAAYMAPEERLLLETAWHVFEQAGYTRARLANWQRERAGVGVFVGCMHQHYRDLARRADEAALLSTSSYWGLANRLSYTFDLRGPSFAIDAACASGLTAVHMACEALRRGECGMALAGGVNLSLHPAKYVSLTQVGMLSTEAESRGLGVADGLVPGEGVGALLLKPLEAALADGDPVLAIIVSSAAAHGGAAGSYAAVNPEALAHTIETTIRAAEIEPGTLTYLELAANGSPLGDALEFGATAAAVERVDAVAKPCAVGTVKSNIGHLEAASGISQIAKLVLQMRHGQLAPTIHADPPNPDLPLAGSGLRLQQTLADWPAPTIDGRRMPRRAGITSVGAGGSYAHVVLEEPLLERFQAASAARVSAAPVWSAPLAATTVATTPVATPAVATTPVETASTAATRVAGTSAVPQVLPLSARTAERLALVVRRLADWLRAHPDSDLRDVAYTLQIGREALVERLALVASSADDAREMLDRWLSDGRAGAGLFVRTVAASSAGAVADAAISRSDWPALARAWADGAEVPWHVLHADGARRMLALPVYPFEPTRAWIAGVGETPSLSVGPANVAAAPAAAPSTAASPIATSSILAPPIVAPPIVAPPIVAPSIDTLSMATPSVAAPSAVVTPSGAAPVAATPSLTAPAVALESAVRSRLAELAGRVLDVAPAELTDGRGFVTLGMTSVGAVHLVRSINHELGLRLRTTALFECATVADLSRLIVERHGPEIQPRFAANQRPAIESASDDASGRRETMAAASTTGSADAAGAAASDGPAGRIPHAAAARPTAAQTPAGHAAVGAAAPLDPAQHYAVVIHEPQLLSDLQVHALTPRAPGAGEVRIDVRAFSLNFGDLLCVQGLYPTMPEYPFTPGFEVAGVISAIGAGVTRLAVGDEVIALTGAGLGGHATTATVPEWLAVRKPRAVTFEEAAAFPVAYLTMRHAFDVARVEAGERVLIQTAAGGLGLIGLQLAQRIGAEVIATAGSARKLAYLRERGVTHVINYREEDFAARAREITGGRGVDVLFNTLAGDAMQKGLQLLAPGGRYVEIAMTGLQTGGLFDLSCLSSNQSLHAVDMRRLGGERPALLRASLERMADALAAGEMRPTIDQVFELSQVREAYACVANASNIGKIVIAVPPRLAPDPSSERANAGALAGAGAGAGAAPAGRAAQARHDVRDGIAVIGMSGRFPGANDLAAYWNLLREGRSAVREVPPERWDWRACFNADRRVRGGIYTRWGGFLDAIDQFDALFFRMSGREAAFTDPQQRLFLEECWRALEDAGLARLGATGARTGVFAGAASGDYQMRLAAVDPEPQAFWGNSASLIPARISYFLNLAGPSVSIDTACSASLVAIHLACQSLSSGECDVALAGGVYVGTTPGLFLAGSAASMFAPDGKCKAFDADADGFVAGEGVAAVVLKPLAAAERDRDQIHAVILGSGTNQDGRTYGITVPSARAQAELEWSVYQQARVDPRTIGMVETHGTGTRLGDPVEVDALTDAFRRATPDRQFCALGSVKTNIGHAAAAAGIAGFIKAVLAMQHGEIPASLHFERPNAQTALESSPFFVNRTTQPWRRDTGPRRAAVSSFGFSGTNAHVVLQEYRTRASAEDLTGPVLVPLSARDGRALTEMARQLAAHVRAGGLRLADVAYTLQQRRESMEERLALTVDSFDALAHALERFAASADGPAASRGHDAHLSPVARGRAGRETDEESLTAAEAEVRMLLQQPLTSDRLQRIGAAWVRGAAVEWSGMPIAPDARTIGLPGYPFARERHWIDVPASSAGAPSARVLAGTGVTREARETGEPAMAEGGADRRLVCLRPVWHEAALPGGVHAGAIPPFVRIDAAHGSRAVDALRDAPDRQAAIVLWPDPPSFERVHDEPLDAALARGVGLATELLRIVATRGAHRPFRLVFAARMVAGLTDPFVDAVSALIPSLRQTLPQLSAVFVHVDERGAGALADCAAAELIADDGATRVRYVRGVRSIAGLEQMPEDQDVLSPIRPGGVYVISGGTGALGRHLGRHLTVAHGAQVILLGRRPIGVTIADTAAAPSLSPSPSLASASQFESAASCDAPYAAAPDQSAFGRIEEAGVSIATCAADVTRVHELSRALNGVRARYGRIDGVFHLAGSAGGASLLEKSAEEIERTVAAKVAGALALDRLTRHDALDFFAMFSSTSAWLGDVGRGDYAAGNRFLDAFAPLREEARRDGARSGRTVSLGWSMWREGGMHGDREAEARFMSSSGFRYIERDEAWPALERCLANGGRDPHALLVAGTARRIAALAREAAPRVNASSVASAPAPAHASASTSTVASPVASPIALAISSPTRSAAAFPPPPTADSANPATPSASAPASAPVSDIAAALPQIVGPGAREMDDAVLREALDANVREQVGTLLRLNPSRLDLDENLGNFGFDSLLLADLASTLSARYGVELQPQVFYAATTIRKIGDYLLKRHRAEIAVRLQTTPAPSASPSLHVTADSDSERRSDAGSGSGAGPDSSLHGDSDLDSDLSSAAASKSELEPDPPRNAEAWSAAGRKHEREHEPGRTGASDASGFDATAAPDRAAAAAAAAIATPVAVIGMAGRFPGSRGVREFWDHLAANDDLIVRRGAQWGGFIDDVDRFDAGFFGIAAREAEMMDPQQRLLLQVVHGAFEDAGYSSARLAPLRVGVFVGVEQSDYAQRLWRAGLAYETHATVGTHPAFMPNRVSHVFNLRGPSEVINAGCASATLAVHRAIESLSRGECDVAIAAGSNVMLNADGYGVVGGFTALNTNGQVRVFEKGTTGSLRAECVAAVLLAPLGAARAQGDRVHAAITGSAATHGGRGQSVAAPNPEAQAESIRRACARAGVEPRSLTYLEAQATATELGDAIELVGYLEAFDAGPLSEPAPSGATATARTTGAPDSAACCAIGALKPTCGHAEAASGLAALIKVVSAIAHRTIPPLRQSASAPPLPALAASGFYLPTRSMPWNPGLDAAGRSRPRRAGLQSYGLGGLYVHLVIEEAAGHAISSRGAASAIGRANANEREPGESQLIVLSARNETRLRERARDLELFLGRPRVAADDWSLADIAFTLQHCRDPMPARLAIVAASIAGLRAQLGTLLSAIDPAGRLAPLSLPPTTPTPATTTAAIVTSHATPADASSPDALSDALHAGDLQAVAARWIRGADVDWSLLANGPRRRIVSLPTYPFARDRHWIDEAAGGIASDAAGDDVAAATVDEPRTLVSEPRTRASVHQPASFAAADDEPESTLEWLRLVVADCLKAEPATIAIDTPLASYGLDSLLSSQVMQLIQMRHGRAVPFAALTEHPTLRRLAAHLDAIGTHAARPVRMSRNRAGKGSQTTENALESLLLINPTGTRAPSFWVHGAPGTGELYVPLSAALGPEYPVYAFQARGVDGVKQPCIGLVEMASQYVEAMLAIQPSGPYFIGGYSSGGLVAYEIAQQITRRGLQVGHLIVLDTYPPEMLTAFGRTTSRRKRRLQRVMGAALFFAAENRIDLWDYIGIDALKAIPETAPIAHLARLVKQKLPTPLPEDHVFRVLSGVDTILALNDEMCRGYALQPYDGSDVLFFKTRELIDPASPYGVPGLDIADLGFTEETFTRIAAFPYLDLWRARVARRFDVVPCACDHLSLFDEPHVAAVRQRIASALDSFTVPSAQGKVTFT